MSMFALKSVSSWVWWYVSGGGRMVRSYRPVSALYEAFSRLGYVKPGSKHEQAAGSGGAHI